MLEKFHAHSERTGKVQTQAQEIVPTRNQTGNFQTRASVWGESNLQPFFFFFYLCQTDLLFPPVR